MKKLYILVYILILTFTTLNSQTVKPDLDFGIQGIASINPGYVYNNFQGMHSGFQTDGKILIVSSVVPDDPTHSYHVTRLNPNGLIDSTFGNNGNIIGVPGYSFTQSRQLYVFPDNSFLVVGTFKVQQYSNSSLMIVKYNQNGSLDLTFANNGIFLFQYNKSITGKSILFTNNEKILVLGRVFDSNNSSFLLRINLDGTFDNSFGFGGIVFFSNLNRAYEMTEQQDGKILVTGETSESNSFTLLRFNQNGSLDNSFASSGVFSKIFGNNTSSMDVKVWQDRIYIGGGISGNQYAVLALNNSGFIDNSFGVGGLAKVNILGQLNYPYKLLVEPDGKLILGGVGRNMPYEVNFSDIVFCRFNQDGSRDSSFAQDGIYYTYFPFHDGLVYADFLPGYSPGKVSFILAIGYMKNTFFAENPIALKLMVEPRVTINFLAEPVWFDEDFDGYSAGLLSAVGSINPIDSIINYEWFLAEELLGEGEEIEIQLKSGENKVTLRATFLSGAHQEISKTISVIAASKNLNIPVEGALSSINNYFVFPSLNKNMYMIDSLGAIKYLYETGGAIKSTPAVSEDNQIYTGTNDTRIYSFDIFLNSHWDKAMGGQIETTPGLSANGQVLYTGTMNGLLKAIKSVDGSPLWTISTGGSLKSSPVVVENNSGNQIIYFIVSYTNPARAKLFAIEDLGNTYQELWNMDIASEVVSTPALINSNENTFICFGDLAGNIYRVRWDGYYEANWVKNLGSAIYASPVSGVDNLIYYALYNGKLIGINIEFTSISEPVHQYNSGENIKATPSIGNAGIIYIATNSGSVIALKRDEGNTELKLEWQLKIAGAKFKGHTIITSNDVLVLIDENGKYIAVKEYNQPLMMNNKENKWGTYKGNAKRSKVLSNLLTGVEGEESLIVKEYKLEQNYPNPFNPSTQIKFTLSKESRVKLSIYNVSGEVVRVLIDENRSSGNYSISFDGSNLSSGVYIYRLEAVNDEGVFSEIRKMTLLK